MGRLAENNPNNSKKMNVDDPYRRLTGQTKRPQEAKTKQEGIHTYQKQTTLRVCLCSLRVVIGTCLAILIILKDLIVIVTVGMSRSFIGTVSSLVGFAIDSGKQLIKAFVRAILRGVLELWKTILGIILQVVDKLNEIIKRRFYQLIKVLGYSLILVIFVVTFIVRCILSLFFSDWEKVI